MGWLVWLEEIGRKPSGSGAAGKALVVSTLVVALVGIFWGVELFPRGGYPKHSPVIFGLLTALGFFIMASIPIYRRASKRAAEDEAPE